MNITHLSSGFFTEEWFPSNPERRMTVSAPEWAGQPPQCCSITTMEMARQGGVLPHRDNVEELILILEGIVEVRVEDETHIVGPGHVVLVSAMQEHALQNLGPGTARAVGFYPATRVVSTFPEALMPSGIQTFEVVTA